ncbi:hypothetical protein GP486_006757 [Trichoglossum hirsutum]|uniref:Uncharacterized protein n=1 Tax=Trichoglossum hirsutum TaxID=265104 RepID=A0A9P8L5C6_9PEZI|nr:hypothetical protein GP486_006757 [Trichoglossum hirsutum]
MDLQSLYEEVMAFAPNEDLALERTPSGRSISLSQSEVDTVLSQRSSNVHISYRLGPLEAFQIRLHANPPGAISTAINDIVDAEVSEERLAELRIIAKEFRERCCAQARAEFGEYDFLSPLCFALEDLAPENLSLHGKADWREELKPVAQHLPNSGVNLGDGVQQLGVDHVSAQPQKCQQQSAGKSVFSEYSCNPQESSTMPSPAPHSPAEGGDRHRIETPCPDISIGIDLPALISALSLQDLNKGEAETFTDWLQTQTVQREPDGLLEPLLLFVPASRAADLAFPFAVVETEPYADGEQILAAENRAAVSGACALKIQLDLDSLANSGTSSGTRPTSSNTEPPLFFSVTTQGPIHEIWCHWTVVNTLGERTFESKLLHSGNVVVLEHAELLVVRLNNIFNWGAGPFMRPIAERLGKIWQSTRTLISDGDLQM